MLTVKSQEECFAEEFAEAKAEDAIRESNLIYLSPDDFPLIVSWMRDDGLSLKDAKSAIAIALPEIIREQGLEYVLSDRWATTVLLETLEQDAAEVLYALEAYVALNRPKKKSGPPPKVNGKHIGQVINELKRKGQTNGEISFELWGTKKKARLVAAHWTRWKKRPVSLSICALRQQSRDRIVGANNSVSE